MDTAREFAAWFRDLLDRQAEAGAAIEFWWRDDDATEPSDALDALLAAANRFSVPIALAVIPEPATPGLAGRLEEESGNVVVFQHGYAHRNHAPKGEKAMELGAHRPADTVLCELAKGREKLEKLFGARFLPVLTPPWNRIGEEVAARRGEIALAGLTTFARMNGDDRACVNTHVDIIDWKGGRKFAGYGKMAKVLAEEITLRRTDPGPVGLLTHHIDHDAGCREFIEAFLSVAATHPAARWPAIGELFGLTPPGGSRP